MIKVWAQWSGVRLPLGAAIFFLLKAKICSAAHSASYLISNGVVTPGIKLQTQFRAVRGAMTVLPKHISVHRHNFTLTFNALSTNTQLPTFRWRAPPLLSDCSSPIFLDFQTTSSLELSLFGRMVCKYIVLFIFRFEYNGVTMRGENVTTLASPVSYPNMPSPWNEKRKKWFQPAFSLSAKWLSS